MLEEKKSLAITRASDRAEIRDRFNPAMLTTAREARRHTQTSLAGLVGVSQSLIGKWEAELSIPDDSQIEALASELGVRREFFFVDRPRRLASMSDFYHRALSRAKRVDVKAIHARCSIIDLQIDRLLQLVEPADDSIPSIDPQNHAGNIERIAEMARVQMGVEPGPIADLTSIVERNGGLVIDRGMEVDDVEALCRWVPALPKMFFMNGQYSADRVRFSLAHELGHTIMHFKKDRDPTEAEKEANQFASAFLMPRQDFRRDVRGWLSISDLASLKRKWRVSMQAIAYRANQIGAIDDRRFKSLFVQMSRNGWRKSEPVEVERETPRQFRRLLAAHIEAGYARSDLAKLLLMQERDIDEMLADHLEAPTQADDGVRLRLVR